MEKYSLKLEKFSGPLEKLLELIEGKKLEISEISLAEITDDFLRYIETIKKSLDLNLGKNTAESDESEHFFRLIADFVSVASRLILIKSKILLPNLQLSEEEEKDIKDLEKQLQIYRDLKAANKFIQQLWKNNNREFSRPYLSNLSSQSELLLRSQLKEANEGEGKKFFYPGEKLTERLVFAAISKIFKVFESFAIETKIVKEKIITLEEKIGEIIDRLKELSETTFKNIVSSASRSHVIVSFLAILHLAREQIIFLEQKSYFSDIIIKKSRGADRAKIQ